MKRIPWPNPFDAKRGIGVEVTDVIDEMNQLVREAGTLGHDDGGRNWPRPAGTAPTEAETALRTRAQRLMLRVTRCHDAEMTRARQAVEAATERCRRESARLPEVLRRARAVFDEHARCSESPLLEAAREAESAQRRQRAEELRAGASFDTRGAGAGAFGLMLATLAAAIGLESALTAMLIADAHPQGIIGASIFAATVAGLQLAYAFSVGRVARALHDRGGLPAAVLVALFGVAGLVLGHAVMGRLRELTLAIDYETAMRQAVPDVLLRHVLPTEASAVLLSLVGIACGLAGLVMGVRRADARRAEEQGRIAAAAAAALDDFARVRAEVEDGEVDTRAAALLDELDAEVAQARDELAEAVRQWQLRRDGMAGTQSELAGTYRLAIERYRARAARLRSDAAPAHWHEAGTIAPLEVPGGPPERGPIEAAQALLADGRYQQALDAARQELERTAQAHARQRGQRLAQIEEVIHHRDWACDVAAPQAPAVSLVTVGELRRVVTPA